MNILFVSQEKSKIENTQGLEVNYITFDEYINSLNQMDFIIYDLIFIELFGDDETKIESIKKSQSQNHVFLVSIVYVFDNINLELLMKELPLENFDYLKKPFNMDEFLSKINSCKEKKTAFLYDDYKMIVKGKLLKPLEHQWKQPLNLIATNLLNLEIKSELSKLTKSDVDNANEKIEYALDNISTDISNLNQCFNTSESKTIFSIEDTYNKVIKFVSPQAKKNNISLNVKESLTDIKISNYENEFSLSLLMFIYIFIEYAIENKKLNNKLNVEISFEQNDNKTNINIDFNDKFYLYEVMNKFMFEFLVVKELLKKVGLSYKTLLNEEKTSIKLSL